MSLIIARDDVIWTWDTDTGVVQLRKSGDEWVRTEWKRTELRRVPFWTRVKAAWRVLWQ